jgi:hypothetical protein
MHSRGSQGLRDLIPNAARLAVREGKVLGAIEVVENAEGRLAIVKGLLPGEIGAVAEERLVERAKDLLGRLPFQDLDVLIVEQMGKNISGSGMDTNVLGRMMIQGVPEPIEPHINIVTVLDLTDDSYGNAFGIGLADVTTLRVWQKADLQTFYVNCMTAGLTGVQRAKLPMAMPTDRMAIAAALRMCGRRDTAHARAVRIRSTLDLTEFSASESILATALSHVQLERLSDPEDWQFAADGTLI